MSSFLNSMGIPPLFDGVLVEYTNASRRNSSLLSIEGQTYRTVPPKGKIRWLDAGERLSMPNVLREGNEIRVDNFTIHRLVRGIILAKAETGEFVGSCIHSMLEIEPIPMLDWSLWEPGVAAYWDQLQDMNVEMGSRWLVPRNNKRPALFTVAGILIGKYRGSIPGVWILTTRGRLLCVWSRYNIVPPESVYYINVLTLIPY
jgi:hypothetical protein